MGIREKTVYNWHEIFKLNETGVYFKKIRWNSVKKELYIIGTEQERWKVWRSKDRGISFDEVDDFYGDLGASPLDVDFDSSGSIYVAGAAIFGAVPIDDSRHSACLRKSLSGDYGTWETIDIYGESLSPTRYDSLSVNKKLDLVFACANYNEINAGFVIRKIHSSETSGSAQTVYSCDGAGCNVWSMKARPDGYLYISGMSASTVSTRGQFLSKCTMVTDPSLLFYNIFKRDFTQIYSYNEATSVIDVHCDDNYIVGGYSVASGSLNKSGSIFYSQNKGSTVNWSFTDYMTKLDGGRTEFQDVCFLTGTEKDTCYFLAKNAGYNAVGGGYFYTSCLIGSSNKAQNISYVRYFHSSSSDGESKCLLSICGDDENNIYIVGINSAYSTLYSAHLSTYYVKPFVLKGRRASLSESIGPLTLRETYEEIIEDEKVISNFTYQRHIANISEFPHDAPYSQMKNTIIGTQTKGTMGRSADDLIQVNHIGSTVKIFWPKQESVGAQLQSYGDFGVTEKVGKLETSLIPGDSYDVTDFDHLSLYCYLRKELSGTMDDVVVSIERKPLSGLGYATEQAIEYAVSGNITEARLKDLHYTKEINYGDLSIKDIGYPIDVPLSNVKEVRISAKHKNGQAADNSKFIVWGRLIKQDANKTET